MPQNTCSSFPMGEGGPAHLFSLSWCKWPLSLSGALLQVFHALAAFLLHPAPILQDQVCAATVRSYRKLLHWRGSTPDSLTSRTCLLGFPAMHCASAGQPGWQDGSDEVLPAPVKCSQRVFAWPGTQVEAVKRDLFRPLTIGLQIRKWKGHGEGGFDWAPPPSVRAFASAAKVTPETPNP